MSFGFHNLLMTASLVTLAIASTQARELRVCADPNNLPFSNAREEGFENKIVRVIADELGADVRYTWWAQRRGFIRNTLQAGLCDLVPGVVSGAQMLRTSAPYYRSTYVFVTRAGEHVITSFDDPVLREGKVGVQLIGADGYNSPPAHALSQRGVIANVRGFPIYGDYAQPAPQAPIVDAVATGEIDVAVVWGPLAGYFAARREQPLVIRPAGATDNAPPMAFGISMGVRKGDERLRQEIEGALLARRIDIDAILTEFHVPRIDPSGRPQ